MKDFYGFHKYDQYDELMNHYKSILVGVECLQLNGHIQMMVVNDVRAHLNNRLQELNLQEPTGQLGTPPFNKEIIC